MGGVLKPRQPLDRTRTSRRRLLAGRGLVGDVGRGSVLLGLPLEVGTLAAGERCVFARHLHAIDRKQLAADEALPVADREDRPEDMSDVGAERGPKPAKVRRCGERAAHLATNVTWSSHSRASPRCSRPRARRRAPPSVRPPAGSRANRSCRCESGRRSYSDRARAPGNTRTHARTCARGVAPPGSPAAAAGWCRSAFDGPSTLDAGDVDTHIR